MDHANTQAKLSIWRDFDPTHPLVIRDEQAGWRVVTRDSGLQAEVYSWPLPHDPFACVADEHIRQDLREALLVRLDVSLPPSKRRLAVLSDFVDKAKRAIEESQTGPLPSAAPSADPSEGTTEPNPLLALMLHIKWLVQCFEDRPGISVSVR